MAGWIDHYRVLQVHQEAERDVIEAAYKKLAAKYHPDVNKDRGATGKMQQLNAARDVLTDPSKRADYDVLWRSQQSAGSAPRAHATPGGSRRSSTRALPIPIVEPAILTVEVADGRPGRAAFILKNAGGPYGRISLQVADRDSSCLQVLGYESLTGSDELPMQVTVEAHSSDCRKTRISHVLATLDGETAEVNVVIVPQYAAANSSRVNRDRGGSIDLSDWLRGLLRAGMAAVGTMILIPGLLLDFVLLLIVLTPLNQAIPDATARFTAVVTGAALSLVLVAPGAALLRRGLAKGEAVEKWWPLSMTEVKADDLWWFPLGLGAAGGLFAWKRMKDEDRGRALKMLTWGIVVSVLQPVVMALLAITKPA